MTRPTSSVENLLTCLDFDFLLEIGFPMCSRLNADKLYLPGQWKESEGSDEMNRTNRSTLFAGHGRTCCRDVCDFLTVSGIDETHTRDTLTPTFKPC